MCQFNTLSVTHTLTPGRGWRWRRYLSASTCWLLTCTIQPTRVSLSSSSTNHRPTSELRNVRSESDNARVLESLESELSMVYVSCESFARLCMFPLRKTKWVSQRHQSGKFSRIRRQNVTVKMLPLSYLFESNWKNRIGFWKNRSLHAVTVWICKYIRGNNDRLGVQKSVKGWLLKWIVPNGIFTWLTMLRFNGGFRSTVLTHRVFYNRF